MELSIVITVFNEQENIRPLLQQIAAALPGYSYEVVIVDDGSTDRTVAEVKQYADAHVKLVIFNANYGQTAAMAAGLWA